METLHQIKERNEIDFSISALQFEAEQLKREHRHLNSKALERRLTPWEALRLEEIIDELAITITHISRLARCTVGGMRKAA